MGVIGRLPYPNEEDYCQIYSRHEIWMYFRSLSLIMDDQLIFGLGIQLKLSGTSVDLDASEGAMGAQDLEQNPKS
jgi:hypothetical protein